MNCFTEPDLEHCGVDSLLGGLLADLGDHRLLHALEARYLLVEREVLDLQIAIQYRVT
jgi:hypothetical protein